MVIPMPTSCCHHCENIGFVLLGLKGRGDAMPHLIAEAARRDNIASNVSTAF